MNRSERSRANSLDPANAEPFFDNMLKKNRVVIVSATYCTFSTKIKMLLIELKIRFVSLEIDIIPNGREIFQVAVERTKVHTVPQVFFKGQFFGGYDELIAMHKRGELLGRLSAE
jgi:glutaredoxin 3